MQEEAIAEAAACLLCRFMSKFFTGVIGKQYFMGITVKNRKDLIGLAEDGMI